MYDISKTKWAVLLIQPYKYERFSMFYFFGGEVTYRADFTDTESDADWFSGAIQTATNALPNSGWLKSALVEIFAEKYFVELSPVPNTFNDREIIQTAIETFLSSHKIDNLG